MFSDDAIRASLRAVGSITTGFDRARDAVCFHNGDHVGNQILTRVHGTLGTCHGISALEAAFFERARFSPSEPRVGYQYDAQGNRIYGATRENVSDRNYFTEQATSAVLALWETQCPGTVQIPGFEGLNEFCRQGGNRDTFADIAYALNLRQSAALLSEFSLDVILTQQTPAESRAITRTSLLQILERAERGQTSRILFRPRDHSGAEPVFRRNGSFRMREGDGLAMSHIALVTGVEIEENTGIITLHLSDSNDMYSSNVQTMRFSSDALFQHDDSNAPVIYTAYGTIESHLLDVTDVAAQAPPPSSAPQCQEIYRNFCRFIPECQRGEIQVQPQPVIDSGI